MREYIEERKKEKRKKDNIRGYIEERKTEKI